MKDQRDEHGRFIKGNRGGKGGNTAAKRALRFRNALYEAFTPEDIEALAKKMRDCALSGNIRAISLCFDRLLGQPVALDVLERLEKLEAIVKSTEQSNDD